MVDAISIALSGLNAQKQRLSATASNIANVSTAGRVPTEGDDSSTVYKPLTVSYTALTAGSNPGGVRAEVTEAKNPYTLAYDPSNIYANNEGFYAVPNVDLAEEAVNLAITKNLFKANLSVIKTEREMFDAALDILA